MTTAKMDICNKETRCENCNSFVKLGEPVYIVGLDKLCSVYCLRTYTVRKVDEKRSS